MILVGDRSAYVRPNSECLVWIEPMTRLTNLYEAQTRLRRAHLAQCRYIDKLSKET